MKKQEFSVKASSLQVEECRHYRDNFRAARYAALADAEGFESICFALEALGLHLMGREGDLGQYQDYIKAYASKSSVFAELPINFPAIFKTFDALYLIVRAARNDAMHIGAHARHATDAAIELCIGLEEALMIDMRTTVGDVMVKSPIIVENWQPVAQARQLMLMHSFSFLPVRISEQWCLISELGLAKFLNVKSKQKRDRLGMSIERATAEGLEIVRLEGSRLLSTKMFVQDVLSKCEVIAGPMLWLVVDSEHQDRLVGVLSPFELM